jgi:hypothetical protein
MMNQKSLPETKRMLFRIAGHLMAVIVPPAFDGERLLSSFKPFGWEGAGEENVMCSLRVIEQPNGVRDHTSPDKRDLLCLDKKDLLCLGKKDLLCLDKKDLLCLDKRDLLCLDKRDHSSLDERDHSSSDEWDHSPLTESDAPKVLNEVSGILGHWFCLMETEHSYIFDIQFVEKGNRYRMISDKMFSTATAYIDTRDRFAGAILSSFLMITFAQSSVLHNTLLIHASVIEKDRKGYAFLGKSGTGKSTHSSLWLRHIDGTELLNDDNPAIRIEDDGSVSIYGTPWSGKTPCYKNRHVPLKALVRLEQAPINRFTWKKEVDALIALLPSCSALRWNTLLYTSMCNVLEELIGKVAIGYLECLPNKDAALLCYDEVK